MSNRNKMNRGRIQAQGIGCQESESWTQDNVPTKNDGITFENALKGKLTKKEIQDRQSCFLKFERFINKAPKNGYDDNIKSSFTPYPPIRDVRVDVEIIKGRAFKD